jgi:CheY-like chemotaxis protein
VSKLVLIVDDNDMNLRLATEVLEVGGFAVAGAIDALEAQRLLADRLPDLILMDIALPGMDGLTLTRTLKSDERLRHIPVIALTAFAMKGDDLKALDAGCSGYITKPIDTRTLARQVADYIEAGRRSRKE